MHQLKNSSTQKLINLKTHQLKNSSTQKLINLKTHQLKNLNCYLLFYNTVLIFARSSENKGRKVGKSVLFITLHIFKIVRF